MNAHLADTQRQDKQPLRLCVELEYVKTQAAPTSKGALWALIRLVRHLLKDPLSSMQLEDDISGTFWP